MINKILNQVFISDVLTIEYPQQACYSQVFFSSFWWLSENLCFYTDSHSLLEWTPTT